MILLLRDGLALYGIPEFEHKDIEDAGEEKTGMNLGMVILCSCIFSWSTVGLGDTDKVALRYQVLLVSFTTFITLGHALCAKFMKL